MKAGRNAYESILAKIRNPYFGWPKIAELIYKDMENKANPSDCPFAKGLQHSAVLDILETVGESASRKTEQIMLLFLECDMLEEVDPSEAPF